LIRIHGAVAGIWVQTKMGGGVGKNHGFSGESGTSFGGGKDNRQGERMGKKRIKEQSRKSLIGLHKLTCPVPSTKKKEEGTASLALASRIITRPRNRRENAERGEIRGLGFPW